MPPDALAPPVFPVSFEPSARASASPGECPGASSSAHAAAKIPMSAARKTNRRLTKESKLTIFPT
jgi:hypothetical protein